MPPYLRSQYIGDNKCKVATGEWSTIDLAVTENKEDVAPDMVQTLASKGADLRYCAQILKHQCLM
ncbi:hypothetical protein CXF86_15155 [Shewanella sp. GutCb]|uniref:hypothetical protein n=1 Tax=Shewanella sp. GutCb TaxID=2058315 RepID=UPI000C7CFBA5|nr:hypothetical protein [Shewanella sp. GutCb]PKG74022.1 hypothetical protein CXF86_15155 [Shewanella sp. GutCb]